MADKYLCRACSKVITPTSRGRYRTHTDGNGPCKGSGKMIPGDIPPEDGPADVPKENADFAVCPQCERKVKLTRLGYFEPHDQTPRGGDRCPVSGVRAKHARKLEDVPLPGDGKPPSAVPRVTAQEEITSPAPTSTSAGAESTPKALPPGSGDPTEPSSKPVHEINLERQPMEESSQGPPLSTSGKGRPATATDFPESTPTSTGSSTASGPAPSTPSGAPGGPEGPAAVDEAPRPLHLAPLLGDGSILQPFSHILQPTPYDGPAKALPMGDLAKELATRIKETFYAYSNRRTKDNRSAQTTLGPSEIGTPCDRRLAMALLGVPAVNPGGDGWAAFVGTCTHAGMAEVYTFADAGTGRYAVELPVSLGVPSVPRGTTDLLIRQRPDGTVIDWKVMGAYSLKKFKAEGPSKTYRTQGHVYGLGAELGGEKVRNVAVVGLPRAGSSLDEMHVWTERYDRKFAQAALDRVEKIADEVANRRVAAEPMQVARKMPTDDDCRYCPFHLKGDKDMKRGCPGK